VGWGNDRGSRITLSSDVCAFKSDFSRARKNRTHSLDLYTRDGSSERVLSDTLERRRLDSCGDSLAFMVHSIHSFPEEQSSDRKRRRTPPCGYLHRFLTARVDRLLIQK